MPSISDRHLQILQYKLYSMQTSCIKESFLKVNLENFRLRFQLCYIQIVVHLAIYLTSLRLCTYL